MPQLRYGIKSKITFYSGEDLSDWTYTGSIANNDVMLTGYKGSYNKTIIVPKNGNAIKVGDYYLGSSANCPFYDNENVTSIDLNNTPFANNSAAEAFTFCYNLTSVTNINSNVTNMSGTFRSCYNLNQNIQIPNSVQNMYSTFYGCDNLNQNIQIPNSVTGMYYTFFYCNSLNQNIQIPNSVTNMSWTFFGCTNLNQNIQIGNSVRDMSWTFYNCTNLNQNIQIPSSVTNMHSTFQYCTKLQGTINVLSNQVTNASGCFESTTLPKNVYIPFTYSNGVNSATFNSFVSAGYLTSAGVSTGQHGATMYNLNA